MAKAGILHDYDLIANVEKSAQRDDVTCPICDDSQPKYQWSDYSGEAMCMKCGCPFQLKWGTDEQREEGNYPYIKLLAEWIPTIREYYQETKAWTCLGAMLGARPGLAEFDGWVEKNHPELLDDKNDNSDR